MCAEKISSETVRTDFNDPVAVVHYARAAHFLGLWESERRLIERFFPDRDGQLIEAGCGAGRVTIGLWDLGFRRLTAFDFAEELLDQARSLAKERGADGIHFFHADATKLDEAVEIRSAGRWPASPSGAGQRPALPPDCALPDSSSASFPPRFHGALFMFNGLMQIPGRANRRAALAQLARVCRHGAPFLFTTHDRNISPGERQAWREEAERWSAGTQDPRLVEFGDRYFEDETGRTFMHLPDRDEILADLAATGWERQFDLLRRDVALESRAVLEFSDECRFWVARRV